MSQSNSKCIMVQGTSSNAGKSIMVAALCRIYSRRGYRVTPFKSQNMSLNSYTTEENTEIAIAQVLQAEAAGLEPSHHMNPVLLKPKEDFISQVIVHGKPAGDMNFYEYQQNFRDQALEAISESLEYLKNEYDLIFIEGAGSPAEINMRDKDLANMEIAHLADAHVILVADIDRGGVFASIAGTFSLLDEKDRTRIKAVVINKFRGNLDILMPGIHQIEKIIGVPVLGVLPYDHSLKLPEEDSASLSERKYRGNGDITIGVMRLPRISNFTDLDPLEYEPGIGLKLIEIGDKIGNIDALIIPGTRNTVNDIIALNQAGFSDEIRELSKKIPIIGICGGYQMLGNEIIDETLKESKHGSVKGLELLDIITYFGKVPKIITRSQGLLINKGFLKDMPPETITGYELHEGITEINDTEPLLKIIKGCGNTLESGYDGAIQGNVMGTYFHGIFHNYYFRRTFTDYLRDKKGLRKLGFGEDPFKNSNQFSIDRLAEIVENNMDMEFVDKMVLDNIKKD
ncbi:MAG: cobyric acid synthase CobQ [Euryarchaeota archaeon]|nr:cobyric acid synthase CobQ [Euryarchaeota archaeon]MBU4608765.1 cobyric acid synthase CobQ [Euryarchaeota archaeon]MBV1730558.1 cobyric acid synthase CobQ [Methanobacterium sp.]MBV1756133.1 cobyric acid synthase CobQ [Methanobacterium sp.]